MYNKSISTLCLLNLWKISSTKTNRNCPCPIHHISPIYVKRVFMKIQYFKSIYKFCELQGRGEHSYCTCEQILDYTNNPGNVFTLILYCFIGSLGNFRFCQIRHIYPTLLFWSKLQNACKNAKFVQKYQKIKRGGFFFNTL